MSEQSWQNRITELRTIPASELMGHDGNWRVHPQHQVDAMAGVLGEVGIVDALLVYHSERQGGLTIIDGHLRRELRADAAWPCLMTDLDDTEADYVLATFDWLTYQADVDRRALDTLLSEVATQDAGVRASLDEMIAHFEIEAFKDTGGGLSESEEPELTLAEVANERWQVKSGDIWQCGNHFLLCGDSSDVFSIESFFGTNCAFMIWTDPPYGVSYGKKNEFLNSLDNRNRIQSDIVQDSGSGDETEKLCFDALSCAYRVSAPGAALYLAAPPGPLHFRFINAFNKSGFSYKHQLVWVKNQFVLGRADYHYRHEPILYGWKEDGPHYFTKHHGKDTVFEFNKPHRNDLHPTMKPVELIVEMVKNSSRRGDIVYDPFCGSGSTLMACEQSGRVCYTVDIVPEYIAVTLDRWHKLTGLEPKRLKDTLIEI